MACLQDGDLEEFAPTPSHPFTPDVVAWAEKRIFARNRLNAKLVAKGGQPIEDNREVKAARQILAATGRG